MRLPFFIGPLAVTALSIGCLDPYEPPELVTINTAYCVNRPVWIARQSGTGPWEAITPAGDDYTFTIDSAKGAVTIAYSFQDIGTEHWYYSFYVLYLTRAELAGLTAPSGYYGKLCSPADSSLGKTVHATVTGADTVALIQADRSLGGLSYYSPGFDTAITFYDVTESAGDILARQDTDTSKKMFLWRNIDFESIANEGYLPEPLDFAGPRSFVPTATTLTVNGVRAEEPEYAYSFHLVDCDQSDLTLVEVIFGSFTSNEIALDVLPSELLKTTERYRLAVSSYGNGVTRYERFSFADPTNRAISLPEALAPVTVTDESSDFTQLRFQFTLPGDEIAATAGFYLTSPVTNTSGFVSMETTPGYLTDGNIDLRTPDYSTITGWDTTWLPLAPEISWNAGATNRDGWYAPAPQCGTYRSVSQSGVLGSPAATPTTSRLVSPKNSRNAWEQLSRLSMSRDPIAVLTDRASLH